MCPIGRASAQRAAGTYDRGPGIAPNNRAEPILLGFRGLRVHGFLPGVSCGSRGIVVDFLEGVRCVPWGGVV